MHRADDFAHALHDRPAQDLEELRTGLASVQREKAGEEPLPQLALRRMHRHGEATLEPRTKARLEIGNVRGGTVARQHDLSAGTDEVVEQREELILRPLLSGEKLDVVDEQCADTLVARAPLRDGAGLNRGEQFLGEVLGVNCRDGNRARALCLQRVADGVQQVRLAHTARSVEHERVVLRARERHGRVGGVHRELVGHSDLKCFARHRAVGSQGRRLPDVGALGQFLGVGHAVRVAKHGVAGDALIDARGGALETAQPFDRRALLIQQDCHVGGVRALQRSLERAGAVALAAPVLDRLAQPRLPRLHLLLHHRRDLGEKVVELAVAFRRRGHRRTRRGLRGPDGLVRDEPVERALQFADVVELELRELLECAGADREATFFADRTEDRHARLEVRRSHVDDQAAGEPVEETLINIGNILRRAVAREHDLPVRRLHPLEQSQQLGLRFAPASEELHVVDEQQVNARVAAREGIHLSGGDGGLQLFHELVERDVLHLAVGMELCGHVADGREEVRLAEPWASVDEERVVNGAGRLRHRAGGRDGEAIGRAHHQRREAEPRVESHATPGLRPACSDGAAPAPTRHEGSRTHPDRAGHRRRTRARHGS